MKKQSLNLTPLAVTAKCVIAVMALLAMFLARPAAAIGTIATASIMIDATTGTVLFEKAADVSMTPASMSKIMTVYSIFERLRNGSLSLDDTFWVSENAWRKGGAKSGGSTMFLLPGKWVRVEDLLRGIIVQSGNDACIVVAEALATSELTFAKQLTERGRELGLTASTFRNSTGWPDSKHRMTPRDLATLALRTINDFPEYYHYYAEQAFVFNGIRQLNRNPLLYRRSGVDGLKTGHTEGSGYGLTASAVREDRRLILVVNGLPSRKARRTESKRLLDWGFREFGNYALFEAGEMVETADVWLGQRPTIKLIIAKDVLITLPRNARRKMVVTVTYESPIPAPIQRNDVIAKAVITAPGQELMEVPLLAAEDVAQLGLVGRLGAALKSIFWGDSG